MSLETWAAEEAAHTGSIPEVYELLETWISCSFRIAYWLQLAAVFGFGWGILRAGFLAPWAGLATIGWSVLWLESYLAGKLSGWCGCARSPVYHASRDWCGLAREIG